MSTEIESLLNHASTNVTASVFNRRALDHFVDLAIRGKHRGSSGGEKTARKLALAFLDGHSLDDSAVDGLIAFIRIARTHPTTARDAVKGW